MTARIIPITTNTTIATCIQIHVGDTDQEPTQQHRIRTPARAPAMATMLCTGLIIAAAAAGAAPAGRAHGTQPQWSSMTCRTHATSSLACWHRQGHTSRHSPTSRRPLPPPSGAFATSPWRSAGAGARSSPAARPGRRLHAAASLRRRRLRYRALFTMDRFNRYSILLPAVLGTHGLAMRVFQYWSRLGRAAQAQI